MSRTASETPTDDTAQTTLGRFTDVQERAPDWLWPGWLPLGKLAILDGDPGLGKSTLMFDLAAQRQHQHPERVGHHHGGRRRHKGSTYVFRDEGHA